MKDLSGFVALFIFASPFLGLVILIAYKVYRKFRPSPINTHLTTRPHVVFDPPYRPSGQLHSAAELAATSFLVVMAGMLVGIMAAIVSQLLYIVFLFPLIVGLAGGRLITGAVQMAKIRKPLTMIALSVLAAVTIYGTWHYGRYIGLQLQASVKLFGLSEAGSDRHLSAAKTFVDTALERETGHAGFIGYMLFKAKEGVSIGRFYHSDRLNLGPIGTWIYWALELGLILWITVQTGRGMIRRPFCDVCGNWYGGERHLGGTTLSNRVALLDLIQQKDFIRLSNLIVQETGLPSLELYLQGCEVCGQGQSRLVVRRASTGQKGTLQFTETSKTVLQPQERAVLLNQIGVSGD